MSYKLKDVDYESGDYWVLRVDYGLEIYKTGITHSVRCGQVGQAGEVSALTRAKKWIALYQADDIRNSK